MTLASYYKASDVNRSNIYAPEEMSEFRKSIKDFFKGFDDAVKKDCSIERVPVNSVKLLNKAIVTRSYLYENKDSLLALGLYLLEFRGFNDAFFKEANVNLLRLTHIVFTYGFATETTLPDFEAYSVIHLYLSTSLAKFIS